MRQLAYVFDLNKCIGCHTCTMACKQLWTNREGREYMYWNDVQTSPGKGYPKNWEQKGGGFDKKGKLKTNGIIPALADYGGTWEYNLQGVLLEGKGSEVVPNTKPVWGPNWDEDEGGGEFPNNYYFYLPRICNHCSNPACLAACPRKAIYKRPDGLVVVDQERCRGYRYCVKACPYGKVYFNMQIGKSQKCIGCYPRVEKGEAPACVKQCPGRIRFWGYRDDKNGPVYKLVEQWKVALPLYTEFGTQPNVFYVPPINVTPPPFEEDGRLSGKPRIPLADLEALFGPDVKQALNVLGREMQKRRQSLPSELTEILIGYTNKDRYGI
ncbi:MAG: respiratory nitrate reductase subunit beta [Nitrospiraceae bacterium]|nr:respiratory nitrate reductase subunit beta [Nitrospiraceae bacterium]MDA8089169.1 respiratory nitrate reductase subunit beta [Nitrospiraceae bacterium]